MAHPHPPALPTDVFFANISRKRLLIYGKNDRFRHFSGRFNETDLALWGDFIYNVIQ
jgi:hypothetical protein